MDDGVDYWNREFNFLILQWVRRMRVRIGVLALVFAGVAGVAAAQGGIGLVTNGQIPSNQTAAAFDTAGFIESHYTKKEYRIPVRDGVKLYVSVYSPVAAAFGGDKGPYPFLMTRTPYGCAPYGDVLPGRLGSSTELLQSGYIFVCADGRGRYQSEGDWREMMPALTPEQTKNPKATDESTDTYDTIEFLLKNVANNNGKVGITGTSYPGFYTSASIIDSHPAIKAASPQAPMTNLFFNDDTVHGGAFMLAANYSFYLGFFPQKTPLPLPAAGAGRGARGPRFDYGTKDGYEFYLKMGPTENGVLAFKGTNYLYRDQVEHTTYDDYWQQRDISRHMSGVTAAVMTVGGWFDAEDLSGPTKTFHAIDKLSPNAAANTLVIGPWVHGGWHSTDGDRLGDATFGAKTSLFFRAQIEFPFFEKYLKDKQEEALPKAYVFETGSNVWKKYDAWPPKNIVAKTLYFRANGGLSFDAPAEKAGVDEYVSDPAHPVPFVDYIAIAVPQRYMADDQRFAQKRPDVLTYETEPLTADVTIAGPVRPKLKIASTGTDSDFVVKLIDVYPENFVDSLAAPAGVGGPGGRRDASAAPPVVLGGYEQLVRGEPMRAKFRDSWEKPEPLVPGRMVSVNSEMPDVNHTFKAGHRIMVQVQSSWFPLVDRNPQTFVDIPFAKPEQFVKATEMVYRNAGAASGVEVGILP
jgi:putative CocE/NonD family hydrolase